MVEAGPSPMSDAPDAQTATTRKAGPNTVAALQPRADGKWARGDERRELTELQARFVAAYVENSANATEAARKAGYSEESARTIGPQMLLLPWVQRAIELGRNRLLAKAGIKALGLVVAVLDDASAGLPLRLKAAEIALKADGRERDATRKTEQSKALNEMTVDELEAFIRRGREAAAQAQHPIIEGRSEPITSGDNPKPIDPVAESTV